MQAMNRLIFSLFAVVVNFTTMVLPPLLMAKKVIVSLPSPSQVPGIIRLKYSAMKEMTRSGLGFNKIPPEEESKATLTDMPTDGETAAALGFAAVGAMALGSATRDNTFLMSQTLQPSAQDVDLSKCKIPGHEAREPAEIDFLGESLEKSEAITPDQIEAASFITNDEYRQQLLKGIVKTSVSSKKDLKDQHQDQIQHHSIIEMDKCLSQSYISQSPRLREFDVSGEGSITNDEYRQQLLKGTVKTSVISQKDLERHPDIIQHRSTIGMDNFLSKSYISQSRLRKFARSGKDYSLEHDLVLLLPPTPPPARVMLRGWG